MTEIKIEKKKPMWPWIILILIILGIIAYFVYANPNSEILNDDFDDDVTEAPVVESDDEKMADDDAYDTSKSYGNTYDGYMAFDESIRDSTRIAVDSSYTKRAFSNLTKLVVQQADQNDIEDSKALEDLRSFSVLMTGIAKTSSNTEGFKNFKTACDKIASVLGTIQVKSFPSLEQEVSELKSIASKISVSTPMDQQQTDINSFLIKSRDILKNMNIKQ